MAPHRRARRPASLLLRRVLLVVAGAAAVTGVLAGLARLGVPLGFGVSHVAGHGPLLVLGMLGTVIALERAVALGRGLGYVAPILGALAALAMLFEQPVAAPSATASAVALVAVNVAIVRRQAAAFTWLMLVGSGLLLVGTAAWASGRPVHEAVVPWIAFFVLTIVAERLEMSRLAPLPDWATRSLVAAAVLLTASACAVVLGVPFARRGFGVAALLVGLWQLRFDLARRTLGRPGLPRFAAAGVLAGAAWLVVAGLLFAAIGIEPAGPRYDAALHAVLVGYVLSMIFAHAPVILPAVARVALPFTPWLHLPLLVLHAGLLLRIVGDLAAQAGLRRAGGVLNAAALVLYAATVVAARRVRADSRALSGS